MPKPKTIPHKLTQIDMFMHEEYALLRFTRHSEKSGTHTTWHKAYTGKQVMGMWIKYAFKFPPTEKRKLMSGRTMYTWKIKT